jgi:MoaA/NifB/PqqE/SkfB family radical SAM enzyme
VTGVTDGYTGGPELVNIAYDTGCNLSCPSCNRHILPKLPRAQVAGFATTLDQLSDDIFYIYLAGMGDPFGTPHYYDWLKKVDVSRYKKLREIILNTNGLMWTPQTWSQIPEATRAFVGTAIISIDGASAATYDVNRWPGKWDDLIESVGFISSLRRRGEVKKLRAYYVYQANNFHEMPAMVQFCRDNAFDAVFFARIWNWKNEAQREYDALDVVNPNHPAHQDYLRVAEQTAAMNDERVQVVIMR